MDRQSLILDHMAWAAARVKRFRGKGIADDDLRSIGYLALCNAADDYLQSLNPKESFRAFVAQWILRRVSEAFEQAPIVRMSRRLERALSKCRRAEEVLIAAGDPRPTPERLSEATGIDVDLCREAMGFARESIDAGDFGIEEVADPDQERLLAIVEEVLDQCTELGRTVLLLVIEEDLGLGQVARRLDRPLREVRAAHDQACLTVSIEMRRRGWTLSSWADAIA